MVGESHYQEALTAAAAAGPHVEAFLVAEPDNPYDPLAVRVDVAFRDGCRTVGYIPRGLCGKYHDALLAIGGIGVCGGRLVGGGPGRSFGIWLDVAPADRIVPIGSVPGLSRHLEPETRLQVTGEGPHADILVDLLAGRDRVRARCTLTLSQGVGDTEGAEHAIEVRIDGYCVGELTRQSSRKYLPLVESIIAAGGTPACEASIRMDERRGPQVDVFMPAQPRLP